MRAAALLGAALVSSCLASPAYAFTPQGQIEPADLPAPHHWRLAVESWYTSYTQTLVGTPVPKGCTPSASDLACPSNAPLASRDWAEAAIDGEVALSDGLGLDFGVPVDLVVPFAQNPAQLPGGLGRTTLGFGDLSLGLDRMLVDVGGTYVKARLSGTVAPMGPPGGDYTCQCPVLDGQGNPVRDAGGNPVLANDTVFVDPPTAHLELAAAQDLLDSLRLSVDASVHYPFVRTGPEPVRTWNGISFSWGAQVAWWALPEFGADLDVLGDWTNPSQQDGAIVCQTGHSDLDLSPGVAFKPQDGVTVGADVLVPILASGFEWDYLDPLAGEITLRFDL